MPSGDLGDESGGNTRPSVERFQSAVLICMPLRGGAAQRGVQGFSPAASPVAERRSWGRKRRKNEAFRRVFPKRPSFPLKSRALWARCGVQGGERKRVSSGHNRRRRLATGSRQPKRGFDTAVSKTTIEVADHCPCQGFALAPFCVLGGQLLKRSPCAGYRPSL